MSKLQEKIELYTEAAGKLGIELNADLFKLVTKGLGPSIYKEDSELVSSSNKDELETVKKTLQLYVFAQRRHRPQEMTMFSLLSSVKLIFRNAILSR